MGHTSQDVPHFRCGSQVNIKLLLLNLLFRLRTLSCTGMPSFFPLCSPGAFTRYLFLSLTLVDISLLTCSRCIAPIHSGALDRRKTSCGCMRSVFVRHSAQTAYIDIFPIVFSRGFGQHPVVRFLFDQCNGTLGRSTPSWCHKEAFFSHRRVRRNIYNYDRGTLSSDPITGLWLMFICYTKLLIPWLMLVCFCLP
jgi:hypothetical protein